MFDVGTYRYHCVDHSYLDPYLRKYYATLLHQRIPAWIPANVLSLMGHACVWLIFFLAVTTVLSSSSTWNCLFLLQLYMVLDVMDGMQARKTETSSPLGEYIDHGGDAYNCGFIVYFALCVLHVDFSYVFYALIWLALIIFSLVSVEKKVTGSCVFSKIGNVEIQCFLIILFALMQIPKVHHLLSYSYIEFSLATWILLMFALLGGSMSFITSVSRIVCIPTSYYIFFAISMMLALLLMWQSPSRFQGSLILILFMASYHGEVLFSHLAKKKMPWPDLVGSLLIMLLGIANLCQSRLMGGIFDVLLDYMIWRAGWIVFKVFRYYGHFWLWVNPVSMVRP